MIKFLTSRSFNDHLKDIKKYGFKKFIFKSLKFFLILFKFLYFSFVYFFIFIIKKIILIRFGLLETNAIGHYSCSTEIFLAERKITDQNFQKLKVLDIWHTEDTICNYFLHSIRKRQFIIFPRFIISPLYFFLSRFEKLEPHLIPIRNNEIYRIRNKLPNQFVDYKNTLNNYVTEITFNQNDYENCKKILKANGIKKFDKIITIHNRDSLYNNENFESDRNCKIEDFYSTISYLRDIGFEVIRIGKNSNQSIKQVGVFDYANSKVRSDILDFYLCSITKLHIGCSSGMSAVPKIFKKNIVWTNVTFNEGPDNFDENFVYIPKIVLDKSSGKDILYKTNNELSFFLNNTTNFDYINNSEDEILELVKEKLHMISGTWQKPEDYDYLQEKYKKLYPLNISEYTKGKVSYYYLKKHIKNKIF